MKKKSTSQSAFFNLRIVVALVTVIAGIFLAVFATANPSTDRGPGVGSPKAIGAGSVAPRAPLSAKVTARTSMRVTPQGVEQVHEIGGSKSQFAAPAAPETSVSWPLGNTVWSFDDETASANAVAIDSNTVWGGWVFTGGRLTAHAILGDGTPAFSFSSFDSFHAGVDSAKGADRSLFIESSLPLDDYRLQSFTSQSDGTPDWSFQIPITAPLGPFVSFKNIAVSYDGSTAALAIHDTGVAESTLYVFDANTGDITFSWTVPEWMLGVDLTDDGSLALATHTDRATVIDTATGEILFQTAGVCCDVYYRISGDGSVLLINGNDLDVYEFDGSTYQQVIHFTRPESSFEASSVVSRDGSTVGAFAKDWGTNFLEAELFVFDVASRNLLGSYLVSGSGSFQGNFVDAASSDDGSVMAFASWGTEFHDWPEVMVFNRDVELIGAIPFPGSAFSVDVSADGRYVVGGAKAVHANEFGNGGRIELIELEGTPTPTPTPTPTATPTPTPGIALSAAGRRVQGRHTVDLSWSGATSGNVDVYRDGALIATPPNSGSYTDSIGVRGGNVRYRYQLCEAGTSTCSNEVTVRFGGPPL